MDNDSKPSEGGKRPLRIGVFPKGSALWRVDWFGSIAFPDRMARRRHPSVLVHLSKLTDPRALDDPSTLLSARCTIPVEYQSKRWVSVGTTMLLGIGDIWRDQHLVFSPSYESETFDDVEISDDTVLMVKAGSSLDDEDIFLLPLNEHPWHRHNTHSYCIRVTLPDGRYLVVPCMELIRFYFGSSSDLLSRLFQPPLEREKLYQEARWCPQRRVLNLQLAPGIPGYSASDVARIAESERAWQAAALISASCLRASVAGKEVFPQAVFPFNGLTCLSAVGRWLPRGAESNGTFLVYQLRACSYPFPFRALQYVATRTKPSHVSSSAAGSQSASGAVAPNIVRTQRKPERPVLCEKDGGSTLSPTVQAVTTRRHFPDLDRKPVWTFKGVGGPKASVSSQHVVDDLAVGDPGSSQPVRPVSLYQALRKRRCMPDYVAPVVAAIRELEDIGAQLLTHSQEDGWSIPLPFLVDEHGAVPEQILIHDGAEHRPRRASVFELYDDVRPLCLLCVVEDVKLMPFMANLPATEQSLVAMLGRVAKQYVNAKQGAHVPFLMDLEFFGPRVVKFSLKRWLERSIVKLRRRALP